MNTCRLSTLAIAATLALTGMTAITHARQMVPNGLSTRAGLDPTKSSTDALAGK